MGPGLRSRRWIVAAAMMVGVGGALAALHSVSDPERLDLDDAVRRATPGQFVRLTDGYTHYEIAGPAAAHVVVLAAGFSVPYYIWDPTFDALVEAGFRVLRYDYYGRGFSDRPDVPYAQDLYVRQLVELLDSLNVSGSIDLAGLSLGGSIVTSFADQFPDRVRSLIYVDPSFRSPSPIPPPTPRSGASSPLFSPNGNGPTNSWPTSFTPNAFPTGLLAIAFRCSTGGFAARGCPNWSATRLRISGRKSSASVNTHDLFSSSGGSRIRRFRSKRARRSSRQCPAVASWRSKTRATCPSGSSLRSSTPPSWNSCAR